MDRNPAFSFLAPLLSSRGWKGPFKVQPVAGVGNNRAFQISGEFGKLFLKVYFRDQADRRDRLKTEFNFLTFAWRHGLRMVPEPVARDSRHSIGIYEFINGKPLVQNEIGASEMTTAAKFFQALNQHKNSREAARLAPASEAAFSLKGQMDIVEGRLKRLERINSSGPISAEARKFIQNELRPAWSEIARFINRESKGLGIRSSSVLPKEDRCLSPSDFGFHNTLRVKGGALKFIDFEYAGWDDPAKMVADFYHQPRMSIKPELMPAFVDRVASQFRSPNDLRAKIILVRPLFGIKWSCIMLNDFLPSGRRRRRFSLGNQDWEKRLKSQINKSRHQLRRLFPLQADLSCWGH